MDEVAETGEEIIITKNGKPVAKLTPHMRQPKKSWFGADRGKIIIHGDLDEPVDVVWEAEQGLIDGE